MNCLYAYLYMLKITSSWRCQVSASSTGLCGDCSSFFQSPCWHRQDWSCEQPCLLLCWPVTITVLFFKPYPCLSPHFRESEAIFSFTESFRSNLEGRQTIFVLENNLHGQRILNFQLVFLSANSNFSILGLGFCFFSLWWVWFYLVSDVVLSVAKTLYLGPRPCAFFITWLGVHEALWPFSGSP